MVARRMLPLFAFILLLPLASAVIMESGDAGKDFAITTANQKCAEAGVKAVYLCTGNVVKVVQSDTAQGSTFYKPDGTVMKCPSVSAPQMGAACLQLMMPNLCKADSVCGESPVQPFPGQQNGTPAQPPEGNATPPAPPMPGSDRDAHGCMPSAGYTWCDATQKCYRPWEENCTAAKPPSQPAKPASQNTSATSASSAVGQISQDNTFALVLVALGVLVVAAINYFYFRGKSI